MSEQEQRLSIYDLLLEEAQKLEKLPKGFADRVKKASPLRQDDYPQLNLSANEPEQGRTRKIQAKYGCD